MNVNYLNPFIEASQIIIKDIAGMDSKLEKVYLRGNSFNGDEVIIIIGITGALIGHVILTLNKDSMEVLVKEMYAGNADSLDDELKRSAIAELSNMIAGNASSIFYKKGMKMFITTPTILTTKKVVISNKYPIICVPLTIGGIEGIKLELNISAIENESAEYKVD